MWAWSKGSNTTLVIKELVSSLNKSKLVGASKHRFGTHLELGVNWQATLAKVVSSRRAKDFANAAAIETQLASKTCRDWSDH